MKQISLPWAVSGLLAGVDEAGRGPWAGPVFAAAVILDDECPIQGLADSRKLSPKKRELLYDEILAKALCTSIASSSVEEIDRLNILQATLLAMQRAVQGLRLCPHTVWVDGNQLPILPMYCEAIVQGDAKFEVIGAASILAKVARDRYLLELDAEYPHYGFAQHKGYGTALHQQKLTQYGPCPQHRKSFSPVRQMLSVS